MHIWCWWGIFGPKTVHLTAHIWLRLIFKIIHDRQKKQHTFSFNKTFSYLVLLLLVLFPLSNCLTRTVFFPLAIILTQWNIKVSRGHCELFFNIGKPVTALSTNLSPALFYLIYLSFTPHNVQFWRIQIDAIGGDTVPHIAKNVAAPFLM